MSYHNDPYRVDYLKIYPCLKERPDVLEVLKKSDRKMKYMEVDLKSEQRRKNAENGAESYVPSKEDSLERLVYSAKCQFADDAEGVEDAVIKKDDLCRLRAALDQLSEEERALIHALFFDECSERELEEMMGICGGDYVGKMSLLMDHTAHPGNVADPWYTEDFEATWQDVLDGCQGLLKEFMTERGDSNGTKR